MLEVFSPGKEIFYAQGVSFKEFLSASCLPASPGELHLGLPSETIPPQRRTHHKNVNVIFLPTTSEVDDLTSSSLGKVYEQTAHTRGKIIINMEIYTASRDMK